MRQCHEGLRRGVMTCLCACVCQVFVWLLLLLSRTSVPVPHQITPGQESPLRVPRTAPGNEELRVPTALPPVQTLQALSCLSHSLRQTLSWTGVA
jgi:hypothetical protein